VERIERIEILDPLTVRMVLKQAGARFLTSISNLFILPENTPNVDITDSAAFAYVPIGTGPFKFDTWQDFSRIVLTANKNYHQGRPYLDTLMVWMGLEQSKLLGFLMRGEIDISLALAAEDMELVRVDSTTFRIASSQIEPFYYMLVYNNRHPIFSDLNVRKALSLAIDRQRIIDKGLNGYGVMAQGRFFRIPGLPMPMCFLRNTTLRRRCGFSKRPDGRTATATVGLIRTVVHSRWL
jgi:peptide/nickel transport system substrate-binding protein